MGTSASSRGPGSGTPLVPPWAEIEAKGQPQPEHRRFQTFRTRLGQFASSGDRGKLRSALSAYASRATGGSSVGPRRFGAMAAAGGALVSALRDAGLGGTGHAASGIDIRSLTGLAIDVAIEAIVSAMTSPGGDGEKIRAAMQVALSETLEGMDTFDVQGLDEALMVDLLVNYTRECVFLQVLMDSDRAFEKAETAEESIKAEDAILELVGSVTDKHLRPLLEGDLSTLSQTRLAEIQVTALTEVWEEWEGYEQ